MTKMGGDFSDCSGRNIDERDYYSHCAHARFDIAFGGLVKTLKLMGIDNGIAIFSSSTVFTDLSYKTDIAADLIHAQIPDILSATGDEEEERSDVLGYTMSLCHIVAWRDDKRAANLKSKEVSKH